MFNIFKKPLPHIDFSPLEVDMHSHLIPGVDDGSPDLETSLDLIRKMADMGYKKIITTPHVYLEYYPNDPDTILPGLEALKAAVEGEADTHRDPRRRRVLHGRAFWRIIREKSAADPKR
jgi:protein-tyrosine phosphatase